MDDDVYWLWYGVSYFGLWSSIKYAFVGKVAHWTTNQLIELKKWTAKTIQNAKKIESTCIKFKLIESPIWTKILQFKHNNIINTKIPFGDMKVGIFTTMHFFDCRFYLNNEFLSNFLLLFSCSILCICFHSGQKISNERAEKSFKQL